MKDYGTVIPEFEGEYRWLSNFWPAPVKLDGIEYPTVEHAYQAAKTGDPFWRSIVRDAITPGMAKRMGARDLLVRPDWIAVRVGIMRDLLWQKFSAGSELGNKLLATAPHKLVEGNRWNDTFWGVCKGRGENQLGKLLMERRESLQLLGQAQQHMQNVPHGGIWPEPIQTRDLDEEQWAL